MKEKKRITICIYSTAGFVIGNIVKIASLPLVIGLTRSLFLLAEPLITNSSTMTFYLDFEV